VLFWHDDQGVAGLAWLAFFAWGTWGAWGTGRAWDWHWYCRAWHGNRHFNGRGHDGWCWVDGGFFASGQGGYSQQCCHQGRNFHGGSFLKCRVPGAGRPNIIKSMHTRQSRERHHDTEY
jgi:hypothetical protein